MTTPCIVFLQSYFYKIPFSTKIKASLAVTCVGVLVVSVTDFQLNLAGVLFASAGVLSGSVYQVWIGTKQQELKMNSLQLLYHQSYLSCIILIPCALKLENIPQLLEYKFTQESALVIIGSGVLAFLVNLSTFVIIRKTSPVTYNVIGHFKTCLIVFMGFLVFDYPLEERNIIGISIALGGIYWYSAIKLSGNSSTSKDTK